jgi:hypothetical protein
MKFFTLPAFLCYPQQCCGSGFTESTSGSRYFAESGSGSRLLLNPGPDLDQDLLWQNYWKSNYWKKFLLSRTVIYVFFNPTSEVQAFSFQTWISSFFRFWGTFLACLDPDTSSQLNLDPIQIRIRNTDLLWQFFSVLMFFTACLTFLFILFTTAWSAALQIWHILRMLGLNSELLQSPHLWDVATARSHQQKPKSVFRIHDFFVWIRIRISGSMPLTNGSGSGSCYFRYWPSRRQQKLI